MSCRLIRCKRLVQAQMMYEESYPANGDTRALWQRLAEIRTPDRLRPQARNCLPSDLASGFKQGYEFSIACGDKVTSNNVDRFNSFTAIAKPQSVGKTGDRGYCDDETESDQVLIHGGVDCTQDAWPNEETFVKAERRPS